jgi:hypothetical protein
MKRDGLIKRRNDIPAAVRGSRFCFRMAEDFAPKNPPFAPYGENSPDFMI